MTFKQLTKDQPSKQVLSLLAGLIRGGLVASLFLLVVLGISRM